MGAERVGRHDAGDLGRVGVDDRVAPRRDAGVVDQDVDEAEVVEDLGDHRRIGVGVLDRRRVGLGLATIGEDGVDRVGGRFMIAPIVDRDSGASRGEELGDAAADAASSSRHESDAAGEGECRLRHRRTVSSPNDW